MNMQTIDVDIKRYNSRLTSNSLDTRIYYSMIMYSMVYDTACYCYAKHYL